MLWLPCQGPLEMKEGGGVWRWRAQERRAHGNLYLAGVNSGLQDSLLYVHPSIPSNLASPLCIFYPKCYRCCQMSTGEVGREKSCPHTPAETQLAGLWVRLSSGLGWREGLFPLLLGHQLPPFSSVPTLAAPLRRKCNV